VSSLLPSGPDTDAHWYRSITRELPFNYPYAVKVHYVKRFTAMWSGPAEELFQEVESHFQRDLSSLVRKHFGAYAHGGLQGKIKYDQFHHRALSPASTDTLDCSGVVIDHLNACTKLAHERMMHCIEIEREEPSTVNEHYLSDYKSKYLARYRAERKAHSGSGVNGDLRTFINGGFDRSSSFRDTISYLQAMGFPSDLKREDFLRLLKPDTSEEALDIMAEVRAYYQGQFLYNRSNNNPN
jgi:hypothetical protein